MTQTGVPEILSRAPYEMSHVDSESLLKLMQEYYRNHTPIESYAKLNDDSVSYIMGFVDEEPVRVLSNECSIAIKIRGKYYPACNVRPKMTTFLECDEEGREYFIERNKHPGMTHREMLNSCRKSLKESEVELVKLQDLQSVTGHTYKETDQHKELIEIWKRCIQWNQDALDRGEY